MADATSKSEFDAALKQSNRDRETPSGKRYARQFEDKVFLAVTSKAMQTCLSRSRDTVEPRERPRPLNRLDSKGNWQQSNETAVA
jgi:hypothetical protein